jgi:RNA polymerase sigma-70 factor (ECF subfamily)
MQDERPRQNHGSEADFGDLSRESWCELFAQLADGRVQALERLYAIASRRLYGLAMWHTGSPEDAGDVVQEVFVRVAEQGRRLERVHDPRAWLLTVAFRLSVDVVRRRRRRPTEPIGAHELLVAPETEPERALDADRVSRLLASLPEAQRDAIYLRHFTDCTFGEIGTITGVPTFTAASRYRLGLRRLRRLVGGSS